MMSLENWAPFLAVLAAVAILVGLLTKYVSNELGKFREAHNPVHEAIDKEMTDMKVRAANERSRIDALAAQQVENVTRIVKLEANLTNIEKGQERIEHGQEKLVEMIDNRFDSLSETIREISHRSLKP